MSETRWSLRQNIKTPLADLRTSFSEGLPGGAGLRGCASNSKYLSLIVRTIVTLDLRKRRSVKNGLKRDPSISWISQYLKSRSSSTHRHKSKPNRNLKFCSRWLENCCLGLFSTVRLPQADFRPDYNSERVGGYAKFDIDIEDHRSPSPRVQD